MDKRSVLIATIVFSITFYSINYFGSMIHSFLYPTDYTQYSLFTIRSGGPPKIVTTIARYSLLVITVSLTVHYLKSGLNSMQILSMVFLSILLFSIIDFSFVLLIYQLFGLGYGGGAIGMLQALFSNPGALFSKLFYIPMSVAIVCLIVLGINKYVTKIKSS